MNPLRAEWSSSLRSLGRRPGLTVLAVVTLSLGIGASTAMFSVVDTVLLRPLPYPAADRLVSVYPAWPSMRGHPTLGALAERGTWSWPEYFGIREAQTVFDRMAAYAGTSTTLTGEGPAERVAAARVTWELFPLLGATPVAGRLFDAGDMVTDRIVVLSHGAWVDRFGADTAAIGRSLTLDGNSFEIVGVLPPGLRVDGAGSPELWLPMTGSMNEGNIGNHGSTRSIARLAEGVSIEEARAQITSLFQAILPPDHGEHEGSVFPRQADETHTARGVILIMLGASMLLLLVACGNVAALLLGAGIDRERELAVRASLGASRGRIVWQLFTESAILAAAAVAGGIAAAVGIAKLLLVLAPAGVPGLEDASLNGTVLGFAALVSAVFGAGFGLIPALSLSDIDLARAIGTSRSVSRRRSRVQSGLVVGELTIVTVLAVSGLLLVRTVRALDGIDPGFDQERLIVAAIAAPYARFQDAEGQTDEAALAAYQRQLREEIEAIPGVESVGTTSTPPFTNWRANNDVGPEAWDPSVAPPIAERRFVSANYFDVTGTPILEGRAFTSEDYVDGAPYVVVISEGLAELGWPGQSPIGRPLRYWDRNATVVGVAANVRDEQLDDVTELAFYAPQTGGVFMVRASADPASLVPAIRHRIESYDPDAPILLASPVSELITGSVTDERYRARLMTLFAVLAGLLASLGIYGVTARSVARRTRELGIRAALGAGRGRMRGLVTFQAVRLAVAGAVLGVGVSLATTRVLEPFLYHISRTDPLTLVAIALALPAVAAIAAMPPARRATRVDPLTALKVE